MRGTAEPGENPSLVVFWLCRLPKMGCLAVKTILHSLKASARAELTSALFTPSVLTPGRRTRVSVQPPAGCWRRPTGGLEGRSPRVQE